MKWLALILIALFTGCGTLQNLSRARDYDPSKPGIYGYGGVQIVKAELADRWRDLRQSPPEPAVIPATGKVLAHAIDLPATYVGDTVTWPYCVSVAFGQGYARRIAEMKADREDEREWSEQQRPGLVAEYHRQRASAGLIAADDEPANPDQVTRP